MWTMLEEVRHHYIYTSTLKTDVGDTYNVNECVLLPPDTAYLKAVSYVYYVAGKIVSRVTLLDTALAEISC